MTDLPIDSSHPLPPGPWFGPKQAGAHAGRHERTIRNALHEFVSSRGKRGLRGWQSGTGCCWRVHVDDLDAWIRGEKLGRQRTAP